MQFIEQLKALHQHTTLDIAGIDRLIDQLSNAHLKNFLGALKMDGKPETASGVLCRAMVDEVLNANLPQEQRLSRIYQEINVGIGFTDFTIQESAVNPLAIELKPAFEKIKDKSGTVSGIRAKPLNYRDHGEQVKKYLTTHEFIVLTNLREAFLFDRNALVDYKPFHQLDFAELLEMTREGGSLWQAVKRLESRFIKPELEKEFFQDLKKWFDQFQGVRFLERDGLTKEELIVLLFNKVIFIKTLEDFSLVPFKFIDKCYFDLQDKWLPKGKAAVFARFFDEIEDWFYSFYDTELFKVNVWHFVEQSEQNLARFARAFDNVLGLGDWDYTFGKGLIHYNYRRIDEDVFGKAYEMFIAQERKDSGIFYTHRSITEDMTARSVDRVFGPVVAEILAAIDQNDVEQTEAALLKMYRLAVVDTTSGSGSFLIKAVRLIERKYAQIAEKLRFFESSNSSGGGFDFNRPKFIDDFYQLSLRHRLDRNSRRDLIAALVVRHIHAIDLDERALEIAKTNLWKEAVKIEKRLFNYRFLNGKTHILPNLQLNFIHADAIFDLPIDRQFEALSTPEARAQLAELNQVRERYIQKPTDHDELERAFAIKKALRETLEPLFGDLVSRPTLVALEFAHLYFDREGQPLPTDERGFAAIIGNPPWEAVKPVKKEFAKIGKGEMDIKNFEKWFAEKLAADPDFEARWNGYNNWYTRYKTAISPLFEHQGESDYNFFKLILERDLQLVRTGGHVNLLIPSGIQTDEGCSDLRRLMLEKFRLRSLIGFENRGFMEDKKGQPVKAQFFPDVDSRFKFTSVFIENERDDDGLFAAKFYVQSPEELAEKPSFQYDLSILKRFSPINLSMMEFRSEADYALCRAILGDRKMMGDLGYVFRRELHMTEDSFLFKTEKVAASLRLFEGKMAHQFTAAFAEGRYFVDEMEARKLLVSKETFRIKQQFELKGKNETDALAEKFGNGQFLLDYQTERLGYRAVASSTNERTLICSLLPRGVFLGHSLNYLINFSYEKAGDGLVRQVERSAESKVWLMALMNSLVLNFFIRQKVSANLTMNFLYELPIAETEDAPLRAEIVEKAFHLLRLKTPGEPFAQTAAALGISAPGMGNEIDLRAGLEVLIARDLYGLSVGEWAALTGSFTFGEGASREELDAIIERSKQLWQ